MIGIAIIGAGHWGPNLIRNFHNHQSSTVVMVVDRSEVQLQQVRAHFPDVSLSARSEDALMDQRVDAVVIATPTITHYPLAKAALEAGKHVLVEKPITTSAREGDELGELASRRGLVLMAGHVFIYNTAVQRVRTYIEGGHLGQLYYISMTRTNLGPIRHDVNAAWDLASHDISMVNYWLQATPTSASASGKSWINSGIEDAVFAILRYPGEVLVQLHCSWLHPRKSREVVVVGDRRMLVFDDLNLTEPIRIYESMVTDDRTEFVDSFASYRMAVREGDIVIPRIDAVEPLKAECDHFLECIEHGLPPLTGAAEAVAVVRSLEAIERSLQNGGREECVDSA